MTRDDIIRMAREIGIWRFVRPQRHEEMADMLEQFAKLVYESAFRDANIAASRTIIDAAVLHEREACAKVCEEIRDGVEIAAAIRARSNT